jgi:hypothetical protein
MTTDFGIAPPSVDLAEAQRQMQSSNQALLIVLGEDQAPAYVVGPQGQAPLLIASRATPLRNIIDTPSLMERINAGAPGVVIMDDDQPVGAITTDVLRDYQINQYMAYSQTLGDETIPGVPIHPRMTVICTCCKASNVDLTNIVVGTTMCINGHLLCVPWE